ncbi:MAG: hypothetical protein U5Q16_05110 [Gammaproteobacteria bacterium]|nr:hypothetical protein [Gammaproteobacteria bacterium]
MHGFVYKSAMSVGGTSLIFLALAGYDTTIGAVHSVADLFWLGFLYALVPTATLLMAFYLSWTWPMTAHVHAKLQRIMDKRLARLEQAET